MERIRNREGPPVVYIAFNGKTARPFTDKKELLKFIRCPKSVPTGEAIRDWIDSFGPESHDADVSSMLLVLSRTNNKEAAMKF